MDVFFFFKLVTKRNFNQTMSSFEAVLQNIVKFHRFDDSPELEPALKSAFEAKKITLSIIKLESRYLMKVSLEKLDRIVVLDVTQYLVELLTCRRLNPSQKLFYFSTEGILYSYAEAITSSERAKTLFSITEAYIVIDKTNCYTTVDFVPEEEKMPYLHVRFRC